SYLQHLAAQETRQDQRRTSEAFAVALAEHPGGEPSGELLNAQVEYARTVGGCMPEAVAVPSKRLLSTWYGADARAVARGLFKSPFGRREAPDGTEDRPQQRGGRARVAGEVEALVSHQGAAGFGGGETDAVDRPESTGRGRHGGELLSMGGDA